MKEAAELSTLDYLFPRKYFLPQIRRIKSIAINEDLLFYMTKISARNNEIEKLIIMKIEIRKDKWKNINGFDYFSTCIIKNSNTNSKNQNYTTVCSLEK